MAVRVNASTEYLKRTTDLPSPTNLTMTAWIKSAVPNNAYGCIYCIDTTGGSSYRLLQYNNDSVSISGSGLEAWKSNEWAFVAWACSSTYETFSWFRVGDTRLRTFIRSSVASFTANNLWLGSDDWSPHEWSDTAFANVKVWTVPLTPDELLQEAPSFYPVRRSSLYLWTPLFPGTGREKDWSGNGRDWTLSGTETDEPNPPFLDYTLSKPKTFADGLKVPLPHNRMVVLP